MAIFEISIHNNAYARRLGYRKTSHVENQHQTRLWTEALADPNGDSDDAFKYRYLIFLKGVTDARLAQQLEAIKELNNRLEILAMRAVVVSKRGLATSPLKTLDKVRKCASIISRALDTRSGFSCNCKASHRIMLRLDNLVDEATTIAKSENIWDAIKLRLVLNNALSTSNGLFSARAWSWAELDASVSRPAEIDGDSDEDSSEPAGFSSPNAYDDKIQPKKKAVRFATLLWKRPAEATVVEPGDLCLRLSRLQLATAHTVDELIGVLGNRKTGIIDIRLHQEISRYASWVSPVSLRQLLYRPRSQRRKLSVVNKLRLASKTAGCLLYLYQTSWLKRRWTSNDIHLIAGDNTEYPDEIFVLRDAQQTTQTRSWFDGFCEPTIFALGIFLIELSFEESWDEICRSKSEQISRLDLNDDTEFTVFATETAVINTILGNAVDNKVDPEDRPFYREGPYYLEAVRACLTRTLGDGKTSLESETFRQAVHREIIRPLQFALEDVQHSIPNSESLLHDVPSSSEITANEFSLFDDKDARKEAPDRAKEWFEELRTKVFPLLPKRSASGKSPVKVAILDTGLDPSDGAVRVAKDRILYKSFIPGEDNDLLEDAKDSHGHGTYCTTLLLRVTKTADVYVARVTTGGNLGHPDNITEAIRWAIREGVDIISMSFGFPDFVPSLTNVQAAIHEAYTAGIVLFAAASNGGGNRRLAYPANRNEVIL
ncbi:hypothetical protein A1O3_09882 [Capronia epimyces CBS 606.96]|uniref:Uncharacterized protein n=1 Tax=Capronia epimyces CBS 606.96 TaxID=1182542 RepID=W9XBP6_9EURO|nr:uncharacterized protein A1O3_09882 [Capronia epimyces CBS 606.96]EXJ77653.1 hypothetical protein A1O3_09882 [Capronia epimyces CBS 606.96]